ncbi:SDR family NAD(P)-dependent oxidoreductase [Paraburkholderia sp. BCC1885]|uniref:SDR family NAD(P)-dependent oxidoreductase n=1 Tax=Paraburkholderia sp. BCC1885 TaxID=2562669 RepID=UPI001183A308|nr:SDR family NAD(P)-dependent oxidoreductase [Paraburkholderia sp. BCC1885]
MRLKGKTVLVTGCGSAEPGWGNGKTIAVLFAREGANVFGIDLNLESANETKTLIESEGNQMSVASCDMVDTIAVAGMVDACVAKYGRIDVLVNNVGRSEPGGPVEMSDAIWDSQLDINLKSAFLGCKHVLPIMERQGAGSIINISSVAGLRYVGKPQVAYSAAKAGLMQFARVTAVLYASRGIRINSVIPGLMQTPMLQRLAEKYAGGDVEAFAATRNAQVPAGRMGDAWDVAKAALFLASDDSSYITGTELLVDGGLTAATR